MGMVNARVLLRAARRLHELWQSADDRDARIDIAIAATLAAHAALDALLPDQSRGHRVRDSWRDGSVLARGAHLTGRLDDPLPQDIEMLCFVRHALGRSGEGVDAPEVRSWLAGDGVARTMELLARFERLCGSGCATNRAEARALHGPHRSGPLVPERTS